MNAQRRARARPYVFMFPKNQKDQHTAALLLNTLIFGDVRVNVAKALFEADDVKYPKGSHVILFAQPYGRFAKTMLEIQEYPDLRDDPSEPLKLPRNRVTAHTLPLMMHVEVHQIDEKFNAKLEPVKKVILKEGKVVDEEKPFYIFTPEWNASFKAVNKLSKEGAEIFRVIHSLEKDYISFPSGAFLIKWNKKILPTIESIRKNLGLNFYGIDDKPDIAFRVREPRVGLYKAWSQIADEGWTRFVLEKFGFTYETLTPQNIRQGGLSERFDILIFPDYPRDVILKGLSGVSRWADIANKYPSKYRIGIGKQGIGEVLKFLRDGGTVVTVNNACDFAIKDLSVPAINLLEEKPPSEFYMPGSIQSAFFNINHQVGYGLDREEAIYFRHSPAFEVKRGESLAMYPESNSHLSGWKMGEKLLLGNTSLAEFSTSKGEAILIGFPPIFRSQMHGTFKVLFNTILYTARETL